MQKQSRRFRLQPRILILFLLLGIPPLVFGHLLLVNRAEERFKDVVGTYFGQKADRLQTDLVGHIETVSVQLANLSSIPVIQELVTESNERKPNENEFAQQIQRIEDQWAILNQEESRFLSGILENEASLFLRDHNRVVAAFREIMVTDRYGRLVAASNKVSDYFQADENWWRVAYLEGTGQRFISDLQFDESARAYSLELAEPIRNPESTEAIGIIKGIVDSDELFALLEGLQFGRESVAVLVRSDGSIVTDPDSDERYQFMDTVQAEMGLARRYALAPRGDPLVLLGLPRSGIKDQIPELDWNVIIQAPHSEVFLPFQHLRSWFVYIAIFSVIVIIVLSLVFSWVLSRPIIETDPHLKEV
jgi:hypothetical protein